MKKISFLRQFIKSPKTIGAILPSGPRLADEMMEGIDFSNCDSILEYGPGTGVFTDRIIERKRKETLLMVIEYNFNFYQKLSKKYGHLENVQIIHGSAEDVREHLKENNIDEVDYVVSGLPFANFPTELIQRIFTNTKEVLKPSGAFIAFQYSKRKMDMFREYFGQIGISRVLLNMPPAYVLVCSCGYQLQQAEGVSDSVTIPNFSGM